MGPPRPWTPSRETAWPPNPIDDRGGVRAPPNAILRPVPSKGLPAEPPPGRGGWGRPPRAWGAGGIGPGQESLLQVGPRGPSPTWPGAGRGVGGAGGAPLLPPVLSHSAPGWSHNASKFCLQLTSGLLRWSREHSDNSSGQELRLSRDGRREPGIRMDCCSFLDCWRAGAGSRPGPQDRPQVNQPAAGGCSVHQQQGTVSLGNTCCRTEAGAGRLWPHSFHLTGLFPGPTEEKSGPFYPRAPTGPR